MGIIHPSILFGVPLVLLSSHLEWFPTTSWLPSLPLMAVHHLSRGKALVVLLIPLGIVLVHTFVGSGVLVTHVAH